MTGIGQPAAAAPVAALRILIVDDHAIVREGLKRILSHHSEDWSVAEAGTGFEALALLRRQAMDVVVVDLSMPGMSGLELLKRLRPEWPRMRLLVLSMHAEEQYALRAFKAGAHGYVTKDSAAQELVAAVQKVATGGAYITPALAERLVLHLQGSPGAGDGTTPAKLSDRELEVLRRLVAGQRPTQIAQALHLSVKTVSTHKSRIMQRLGLPNLAALVRYGMEQGMGSQTDAQMGWQSEASERDSAATAWPP